MEEYFNTYNKVIKKAYNSSIDSMKIYAQNQDKTIFDFIEFDNDNAFSEPLLVSHFFAHKNKRQNIPIADLLIGYHKEVDISKIKLAFNEFGISYIPNFGYFESGKGRIISNEITPYNKLKNELKYNSVIKIKETNIELHRSVPYLLQFQFKEFIDEERNYLSPLFINDLINQKVEDINFAFHLIKSLMPIYYNQINLLARGIVFFRSSKLVSFATRVSPGIIYLNIQPNDSLVYFIVEMIHQLGHNVFYKILHNPSIYFKINPDIQLKKLNQDMGERRSLYSAFHGLYTTTLVAYGLDVLLRNSNLFNDYQVSEIVGRFTDNRRRFRTGLEKLILNEVFTEKGIELYNILDKSCENIYIRNKELIRDFNVKNQPFVYNHSLFLKENLDIIKNKLNLCI